MSGTLNVRFGSKADVSASVPDGLPQKTLYGLYAAQRLASGSENEMFFVRLIHRLTGVEHEALATRDFSRSLCSPELAKVPKLEKRQLIAPVINNWDRLDQPFHCFSPRFEDVTPISRFRLARTPGSSVGEADLATAGPQRRTVPNVRNGLKPDLNL